MAPLLVLRHGLHSQAVRFKSGRPSHCPFFVLDLIFARKDIFGEAVFLRVVTGKSHGEVVAHRHIDGAFKRGAIPFTQIDIDVPVTAADLCLVGVYAERATN